MNIFHFIFFFLLVTTTSSRIQAIRQLPTQVSGTPAARKSQVLKHLASAPVAQDFESFKRRIPTGSNPLHNKKR
ncbi:hypothetical protein RND71_036614 [Anisodus tanguticus]|uniref:Uncharacterized protein n=1 Tax=Anisodus tanguticus TaxID=243964 RepID=A0AAE1R1C5_9SOLA|nr:hypothetical protein RND71_036614 [Anisodus tanguticus]